MNVPIFFSNPTGVKKPLISIVLNYIMRSVHNVDLSSLVVFLTDVTGSASPL